MRTGMSRWLCSVAVLAAGLSSVDGQPVRDTITARGGDITIAPIAHGSLYVEHASAVILVDPARFGPGLPPPPPPPLEMVERMKRATTTKTPEGEPLPEYLMSALAVTPQQMLRFQGLKEPTLILVTDTHDDHLDPRVIAALKGTATRLIVPPSAASRLLGVEGAETLANGGTKDVGAVRIEAVAMYNPRPDPATGFLFHAKGRGNGYVLTIGGRRLYVAGDTGCTSEMRALKNIDVAFLPMNLPYTMPPSEAAECARAFRPRIVYPYHHFESDPKAFAAALEGTGIEIRLRDWYLGSK